ncbi:MAG: hypothetical protein ACI915_005370 [Gammaproteobacteria bacterium]|jgi:hypothetical protein
MPADKASHWFRLVIANFQRLLLRLRFFVVSRLFIWVRQAASQAWLSMNIRTWRITAEVMDRIERPAARASDDRRLLN